MPPQNHTKNEEREFTYEEYLTEFCPDEVEDHFDVDVEADDNTQSEQLGHRLAEATIRTLMQAFENH